MKYGRSTNLARTFTPLHTLLLIPHASIIKTHDLQYGICLSHDIDGIAGLGPSISESLCLSLTTVRPKNPVELENTDGTQLPLL